MHNMRWRKPLFICVVLLICATPSYGQTSSKGQVGPALLRRIICNCTNPKARFIHYARPRYPKVALAAKVQGKVILELLIDKSGTPRKIEVISGNPLLAQAALAAAKTWRYQPLRLNGKAVEMSTTAEINFVLP